LSMKKNVPMNCHSDVRVANRRNLLFADGVCGAVREKQIPHLRLRAFGMTRENYAVALTAPLVTRPTPIDCKSVCTDA
jgi:hypothetical protein